jgi:hypothetical protein
MEGSVYLFSYKLITIRSFDMGVRSGTENGITHTLCLAFGWVLCNVTHNVETHKVLQFRRFADRCTKCVLYENRVLGSFEYAE